MVCHWYRMLGLFFFRFSKAHRHGHFKEDERNIVRDGNDGVGNAGEVQVFRPRMTAMPKPCYHLHLKLSAPPVGSILFKRRLRCVMGCGPHCPDF